MNEMAKHTSYLGQIKHCSKAMQKHGATLSFCQGALDILWNHVDKGKGKPGDPFQHCKLQRDKIKVGKYDSNTVSLSRALILHS